MACTVLMLIWIGWQLFGQFFRELRGVKKTPTKSDFEFRGHFVFFCESFKVHIHGRHSVSSYSKEDSRLWLISRIYWYHETSPHDSMNISKFLLIKCSGKKSWVINLMRRNFLFFWVSRFDELFFLIFSCFFLFNLRFRHFCTPWITNSYEFYFIF